MIDGKTMKIYMTSQVISGEITVEEYINLSAKALYDDWVCGRRFEPEDICELIMYEKERREYPNT
jgi:hypothetical protein